MLRGPVLRRESITRLAHLRLWASVSNSPRSKSNSAYSFDIAAAMRLESVMCEHITSGGVAVYVSVGDCLFSCAVSTRVMLRGPQGQQSHHKLQDFGDF